MDHQVGLFDFARDFDGGLFFRNMVTHASIGELFDIPVIMTTSDETGKKSRPRKTLFYNSSRDIC